MKKLILILAMVSTSAIAQHHGHHGHHGGDRWIGPAIIGGIIGYAISQNRPVQQMPPPVIIYQQPLPYNPVVIYQQPLPANPPMQPVYQEVTVYSQDCLCYTKQYRQIGWQ